MLAFVNSVALVHLFVPLLSTGYTLCASAFFPPARFILAASQINDLDDDHDTSLAFCILYFQVSVPVVFGRDDGSVTSLSDLITIVASLFLASAILLSCVAVSTSAAFCKSPLATTICVAGAVMLKS